MQSKTYLIGDHHLGHKNILKFRQLPKHIKTIEEYNRYIIDRHNTIVTNDDEIYFMGDVAWNYSDLEFIHQMNGRKKILILGNHDNFSMGRYLKYFSKVYATKKLGDNKLLSHIPVHPCEFTYRIDYNIHAHHHDRNFGLAKSYINTSLDHSEGFPLTMEEWFNHYHVKL